MAERALSAWLGALLAFGSIAAEARAEPAGRIEVYQQMGGPFGYPGMGATAPIF